MQSMSCKTCGGGQAHAATCPKRPLERVEFWTNSTDKGSYLTITDPRLGKDQVVVYVAGYTKANAVLRAGLPGA